MKPLKQCFTRWFNREQDRRGTLWEERFKSVLVEDGHAARVMAAYIDLNPVRAGMVEHPKDYRWSSYGEAVGGKQRARATQLSPLARGSPVTRFAPGEVTKGPPSSGATPVNATSGISLGLPARGNSFRRG